MKKKKCLKVLICCLLIVLTVNGCTDEPSVQNSDKVSEATKPSKNVDGNLNQASISSNTQPAFLSSSSFEAYINISEPLFDAIENNNVYNLVNLYPVFEERDKLKGEILLDLNKDGEKDVFRYQIVTEMDENMELNNECVIMINDSKYLYKSSTDSGITGIYLCDIDKSDNLLDFYIADDYLSDRVINNFFQYNGTILETYQIASTILGVSGDGKIIPWEGCVDSLPYNKLDKDLVLFYYDTLSHKYFKTNQILGKKISFYYDTFLYKSKEEVVCGAPMTPEEIEAAYADSIIETIKAGQKLTVLSIDGVISENGDIMHNHDDGIQVQTENGVIGWIGGFHMIWD